MSAGGLCTAPTAGRGRKVRGTRGALGQSAAMRAAPPSQGSWASA